MLYILHMSHFKATVHCFAKNLTERGFRGILVNGQLLQRLQQILKHELETHSNPAKTSEGPN